MRPLTLDFRRRPRPAAMGWLLLAAGVLASMLAVGVGQQIAAQTIAHDAARQRIERQLPAHARAARPRASTRSDDAALARLRAVQAQLNLPWAELFATLEALAGADVALLSLSPDARKRQLRLSAEARDLAAMLAFHRRLEDSAALRDVSLVNHEVVEQTPGRPVRFQLLAAWIIDDAHP
jgi:Tfp pilus assembly protein PilN